MAAGVKVWGIRGFGFEGLRALQDPAKPIIIPKASRSPLICEEHVG